MNEPTFESKLAGWTEKLAERETAEFAAWQKEHGKWNPTPDCPPLPRFRTALIRDDWSTDEQTHIRSCDYCRRVQAKVRESVWHPTIAELFWSKVERLSGAGAEDVAYHLNTDRCRQCNVLVESQLFRTLAELFRRDEQTARVQAALAVALVAWRRLAPASFAPETKPPFQLRTELPDGSLSVTVRETDTGELLAHVLSPGAGRAGQTVRVELVGSTGSAGFKDVTLEPREQDGCAGRASFGRFEHVAAKLGDGCGVVATVLDAPQAESSPEPTPPGATFSPVGLLVRVRQELAETFIETSGMLPRRLFDGELVTPSNFG